MNMKLNLNNSTNNTTSGSQQKDNQEREKYKEKCNQLNDILQQDMIDSAIDIEISEDEIRASKKKFNQLKLKKNLIFASILIFIIGFVLFGMYKTFFTHQYTGQEIAILSNYFNGQTNYNRSGLQGFLNYNKDKLILSKMTVDDTVDNLEISDPVIYYINDKSRTISNVYFYVNAKTNNGDVILNCSLPIYCDVDTNSYSPAGDVNITIVKPKYEYDETIDNPILSFDGIDKADDSQNKSAASFCENFFNMFYSGQDVSPYYDGTASLNSNNLQFVSCQNFILYNDFNQNGFNAVCNLTLSTDNGIIYVTKKYLKLIQSSDGKSWTIDSIM